MTSTPPGRRILWNFPIHQDITGARAWFGLVNQAAYAFAMTEEMACFRRLLKPKVKFEWTPKLDKLFTGSKEVIVSKIIEGVHLFDCTLPTCLATDFSSTGLGFFFLQKACTCQSVLPTCCPTGWRLCLVGSRFLHPAETRYAPIEGEALAVAYGFHQCRYFLLGCKQLIVATDHKPLLHVLNDRSLSDIQNRRLQNLKEKTLSYRFQIVHVPGRKHLGPDAASRFLVDHPKRLHLPGEPDETGFEDAPATTEVQVPAEQEKPGKREHFRHQGGSGGPRPQGLGRFGSPPQAMGSGTDITEDETGYHGGQGSAPPLPCCNS